MGVPITSAYFSNGTGNTALHILLDDVACTGTEPAISACQHKAWGSNNCRHNEDAGVLCLRNSKGAGSRRVTSSAIAGKLSP